MKVAHLRYHLFEPAGQDLPVPEGLGIEDWRFKGDPVHNWIAARIEVLIEEHSGRFEQFSQLTAMYQFDRVLTLDTKGKLYPIIGIQVDVDIAVERLAKVLEIELERGRFDAQVGLLWAPPNVSMTFLGIDNTGWKPIEEPTPEEKQTGDALSLRVHMNTQLTEAAGGCPDLSAYVMAKI